MKGIFIIVALALLGFLWSNTIILVEFISHQEYYTANECQNRGDLASDCKASCVLKRLLITKSDKPVSAEMFLEQDLNQFVESVEKNQEEIFFDKERHTPTSLTSNPNSGFIYLEVRPPKFFV